MWKKRLIVVVTFLAGLYYFLEFVVPPTVPFRTVSGVVRSVSVRDGKKSQVVEVGQVTETGSARIQPGLKISRRSGEDLEKVTPESVKQGDSVEVTVAGRTMAGIVTSVTQWRISIGRVQKDVPVPIGSNTLVLRARATGAPEQIPAENLKPGDWASIGPSTFLSGALTDVNNFFIVLASMAWGMALISLVMVHSAIIRKRRPEWTFSVVLFLAVIGGGIAARGSVKPEGSWWWMANDTVYNYMIRPMFSTVFSLLTFYLASAAYRAFKAKSAEAVLMMLSALIIMLGQIPVGLWLTRWLQGTPLSFLQIPDVGMWILRNINSAVVRGLWFGMMLGAIAVALRFWLSLERGAFFDKEL